MSIVIRSNVEATASIGNFHLYNGPMDFDSLLNFERGAYTINGVDRDLSDALAFSRSSVAEYHDANGVARIAAVNEPRIHRLDTGRMGLLLESPSTNVFPGTPTPGAHTVDVPLASGTQNFLSLQVWGSGSVSISTSEPIVDQTPSLTATEGSPVVLVFAPGTRTISVTITVAGSVSRVNLANTWGNQWGEVLPTPVPQGVATRTDDVANIASSAVTAISPTRGSIVAAYSRNPPLIRGNVGGAWFSIRSSGNNLAGIHLSSTSPTAMVLRGYDTGGSNIIQEAIQMADQDNRTFGLSWEGGTMRLACNGLVYQFPIPTLPPFTGVALSGSTAGIGYSGRVNAALTHFVTYDRALSMAELQAATSSWV